MQTKMLALVILFSAVAHGAEKPWPLSELRGRFQVTAETFELDTTGKIVRAKKEHWRTWRTRDPQGILRNDWTGEGNGEVLAFRHIWQVRDDGAIHAHIEQYARTKPPKGGAEGPELVDLLKTVDKVIENMEPITIVAIQNAEHRVVIRFTPGFTEEPPASAVTYLPVSGTNISIVDNQGNVWAQNLDSEGKFAGFATHRGSVYFSYYPFQGASEIGTATGREIEINLGAKRWLTLTSESAFLPAGMRVKVFGLVREKHRTHKLGATGVSNSNEEAEFLKKVPKE